MKLFYFVFILIFLCLIMSCVKSNRINDQIPYYNITDISIASEVKLSELGVVDIQYIPLETDRSDLLSEIKRIEAIDNFFFVSNWTGISKYSSDGSFIQKIGKRGRGPEEYNYIIDFTIDSEDGQIFILSGNRLNGKIYVFSLDGDYVKTFKSPKNTMRLTCVRNMLLCYMPDVDGIIDTSFVLIDYNGKTEKIYPNKFKYNKVNIQRGFLVEFLDYKYKNHLFTKEIYSDTIFVFDSLNFKPAYVLYNGEKTLSPELRGSINSNDNHMDIIQQIRTFTNLFETNSFYYADFVEESQLWSFIGFKISENYLLLNIEKGIKNDIDGGPNIWFKSIKDNNTILSWINAFELKEFISSEDFKKSNPLYPEKKKALEQLANNLNENDNPVLMVVKLKE